MSTSVAEAAEPSERTSVPSPSRPRVLVLAGPTAVGKSSTAMQLATASPALLPLPVEIVSADSVHVYNHLDIASNKPSLSDRSRVPHHLVDTHSPSAPNTAGMWLAAAAEALADVARRGRTPLVVGGTMMYLRWLVHGKPATPAPSERSVLAVDAILETVKGDWDAALGLLNAKDPVRATQLTKNDWYRLRRALQVVEENGSGARAAGGKDSRSGVGVGVSSLPVVGGAPGGGISRAEMKGDFRCFFLFDDRIALNRRIDRRCEQMILPLASCKSGEANEGVKVSEELVLVPEKSILKEVAQLLISRVVSTADGSPARAIGYRQTIIYLLSRAGTYATETAESATEAGDASSALESFRMYVDEFQQATRGYAKQQIQWFRKEPGYIWVQGGSDAAAVLTGLFGLSEEAFVEKVNCADFKSQQVQLREDMMARGKAMKTYLPVKEVLANGSRAEEVALAFSESLGLEIYEKIGSLEISRLLREMGREE